MKLHPLTVPIAALFIAFSSFDAEAQRGDRGNRGNQGRGQQGSRSESAQPRGGRVNNGAANQARGGNRNPAVASRGGNRNPAVVARGQQGGARASQGYARSGGQRAYNNSGSGNHYQNHNRAVAAPRGRPAYGYAGGYGYSGGYSKGYSNGYRHYGSPYYSGGRYQYGYYTPAYYAPRPIHYGYAPRHYYGHGGHLSVYVGFGSGYFYGAAYGGPVYGYRAPAPSYREVQHYGDVRLQVHPRDAAVYVDGYYAGIVDDFDGSSKCLVLETGPHKIEIAAQGVEPQVFDVYVDPARTVELHADLLRYAR